ncbi:cytochrome P450 [Mycena olivaceomarginata]|nr:cytochrome P450 [Mycena olivaceomarginata]
MSVPIPQPLIIPFLGNVASVEREVPLRSFRLLAKTYGEIFRLKLLDDSRFNKHGTGALREVRNLVDDALFTAEHDEPNWGIALFGTLAMKDMMEKMRDISNQLLQKWERFGPNEIIDPSDDFTRVALDTIAYCLMSAASVSRAPRLLQAVMYGKTAKYQADFKKMKDLADEIVSTRKAHPIPKHDLLDIMPNSRDPKTGQSMTEQSIAENSTQGVVDIRPAFSRSPEDSEGSKYFQHRVRKDIADIIEALSKGAWFFTCGSATVAKGIKTILVEIIMEQEKVEFSEAMEKFAKITKGRYATDIFD